MNPFYIFMFTLINLQVCEGRTGHTEAVKVMYDNRKISYKSLCDVFWEAHDPTNKEFLVIISSPLSSPIYIYITCLLLYCDELIRGD